MCAEKKPLECHRAILVSRHLESLGVHVEHIYADGSQDHLFLSREELIVDAYERQEKRIAYQGRRERSF